MKSYFPHNFDKRSEKDYLKIRMQYGLWGYGLINAIEEVFHKYGGVMIYDECLQYLSFELHEEADKLDEFLNYCAEKTNLFNITDDFETIIKSPAVIDNLQEIENRYQKAVRAGRARQSKPL